MAIQPFAARMPHKTAARAIPDISHGLLENSRFTVAYKNRKAFSQYIPKPVSANAVPYFKNPLIICSSASASVSPRVISLTSCSPAIFPIAAS